MIKIKIEFYSGDTWITKGTCRLYITGHSHRCEYSSYQELLERMPFNGRDTVELNESMRMVLMFNALKTDILYEGLSDRTTTGPYDSVNCITLDCVAKAQEIARGSVLA